MNATLRDVATREGVALADAALDVVWTDADLGDAMHTVRSGSENLAAFLEAPVRRLPAESPR